MKTQGREKSRCQGFTLLEILIGVMILGVLLGVAAPNIAKARTQSRIEEAKGQLEIISTAVLRLAWDTGKWPGGVSRTVFSSTEYWQLNAAGVGLRANSTLFPGWKGPYIPPIPADPWGQPYFFDPDYRISNVNYVVVGSFGPNRVGQNLYDADDIYVILGKSP